MEEKEIYQQKNYLAGGLWGGIIGAIIGAIFGIFRVINLGVMGTASLIVLVLLFGSIGLVLGLGYSALPPNGAGRKILSVFLGLIAFFIIIILIFSFKGTILEYMKVPGAAGPIKGLWTDFSHNIWPCMKGDTENCFLFTMWEEPSIVNKTQAISINMKVFDVKIDSSGDFNVKVSLDVNNRYVDNLKVVPKCYVYDSQKKEVTVEGLESYAQGNAFAFPKSDKTEHTSFYCSGNVETLAGAYTKQLEVVLERPTLVSSYLPIWLQSKSQHQRGIQSSVMENWAPYTFSIVLGSDQPLEARDYGFSLKLKQADIDSKLKSIQWIRATAGSSDVSIECLGFNEMANNDLQIQNIDEQKLKQYKTTRKTETYAFNCKLHVLNAPIDETQTLINARALYTIETKKTFLLKSESA